MDQPRTNQTATTDQPSCMFCSSTEYQIPLIQLRHEGGQAFVCPRCLPRLVHPDRR